MGKALRDEVPRSALGEWGRRRTAPTRSQLIEESHAGPAAGADPGPGGADGPSPYGFLRGTAVVMADDVARLPATGIMPVVCGDAHLGNFGFYASPEGELVIDLNDFDEAHPGAWEWDLRRLVASIWVAGRENGSHRGRVRRRGARLRRGLPRRGAAPGRQPLLSPRYNRLDVGRLHETATEKRCATRSSGPRKRARNRTSDRALPRFTAATAPTGSRRIVEEPPLITRLLRRRGDADRRGARRVPAHPRTALAARARRLHAASTSRTRSSASAAWGCARTSRCSRAAAPDDVVFLQLKQARRSVLAKYVHGDSAWHAHQGQRVVEYQQALQTVSDPLLGWTTVGEPAVLRPPVPQHEGDHRARRDGRGRAGRLRRASSGSCWPRGTPGPAARR